MEKKESPKGERAVKPVISLPSEKWVRNRFLIALHKNRKVYSITKPKFWSFLKKKIIKGHVLLV